MGPRQTEAETLRIGAIADRTGVSKELIHHYLRLGLLPRPKRAGLYGPTHVRLLSIIKRLREERFLPLPRIRQLATLHRHDPERIELALLSGPEPAQDESETLDLDELCARTGIDHATIGAWIDLGLLRSAGPDGAPSRFTHKDANVATLVQRGTALGIPLESFRTIRSYVEVAFELEQALFLPRPQGVPDLGELARDFALRRDIASGFVINVLGARIEAELHRFLHETTREAQALPLSQYRPSEAFLRRHGLDEQIRACLGRGRQSPDELPELLRLFFVAGKYREVVFAAERSTRALEDVGSARIVGLSLLFAGEVDRALATLQRAHGRHPQDAAIAASLSAARLHRLGASDKPLAMLRGIQDVIADAELALQAASAAPPAEAAEARALAGWVLACLPETSGRAQQGIDALERAFEAAAPDAAERLGSEPERVRLRVTAAWNLHQALGRAALPPEIAARAGSLRARLAREILCLDPASDIALRLYLEESTNGGPP